MSLNPVSKISAALPTFANVSSQFTKVWKVVSDFFKKTVTLIKSWILSKEKWPEIERRGFKPLGQGLDLSEYNRAFDVGLAEVDGAQYIQNTMDLFRALAEGACDAEFHAIIDSKTPKIVLELPLYGYIISGQYPKFLGEIADLKKMRSDYCALKKEQQVKIINGQYIGGNEDIDAQNLVRGVRNLASQLATSAKITKLLRWVS
jgi:hypothetical protein